MSIIRQYEIKHYGGLDSEKPNTLPWGDTYFSDDTKVLYKYDKEGVSIAINGTAEEGIPISQVAQKYSLLQSGGNVNGTLSYVYESEGTSWLPNSLGGTYYPAGFYTWNGSIWVSDRNAIANQIELNKLNSRVTVTQDNYSVKLANIDSTKEYFLDGEIIVSSGTQIDLSGGKNINMKGYNFNLSGLKTAEPNQTLFVGDDCGDIIWSNFYLEVSGTGSKVMDLKNGSGFGAFEIDKINFNNCTSLGELDNFRQGLETGTGRFGGMPELTLSGTWIGGYYIDTSIVRSLTDGAYFLYKAGTNFVMNSRFRSNQNIDLNSSIGFFDFSPTNLANANTLQLDGCLISRNGVFDPTDTTIIPNITSGSIVSKWKDNVGISNTYVGGSVRITGETSTPIAVAGTFYTLNGTYVAEGMQHFDSPSGGKLRYLGESSKEFTAKIIGLILDSGNNDLISIRFSVYDDSASAYVHYPPISRVINNLQGGRDVAYYSVETDIVMDNNDILEWQVSSDDTNSITGENSGFFKIKER